jgi:hypothetical protein
MNANRFNKKRCQMSNIDDDLRERMHARAREAEQEWREERGLTPDLNRAGNARARKRRRWVECPKEPKGAARYRRYRKKQLGKLGPASKVRRIDPKEDHDDGREMRAKFG